MSNNQQKANIDQTILSNKAEVEAIAQETGASEEQVAQLARARENGTVLQEAAAAAARWS